MPDRSRTSSTPWFLAASSVLLVVIVLYLLFGAYLPAQRHIVQLEAELRDVYQREAELQTRLAQQAQRDAARDKQFASFASERDALAERVQALESQLSRKRGR